MLQERSDGKCEKGDVGTRGQWGGEGGRASRDSDARMAAYHGLGQFVKTRMWI